MSDGSELTARLTTLERRVHRLRGIALLLGIGLLLAVAWIAAPRPEFAAQRFMLRDSTGAWRGALMIDEQNEPVVRLNDPAGRSRLYGRVGADGRARLRLSDHRGVARVLLEVGGDGESRAAMSDSTGRTRLEGRVTRSGIATIAAGDSLVR